MQIATTEERTTKTDSTAVIEADGVSKRYGDEAAVRAVSLRVARGSIFGFIGPSGSGKTTTVRLLTGIAQPSEGEVRVLGRRPGSAGPDLRARIGYMPQLFGLYPDLSVWDNLQFAASLYGLGWRRGRRIRELLDFVELTAHRHKLARQLSGGMQRRLSLAATLIPDPEVIFLDEPTAGIDPVLRQKFWEFFRALRERGRTLFVTTQYVGEAAYCDRVGVMQAGALVAVDTPDGLRRQAQGGELVDVRLRTTLSASQEAALDRLPVMRAEPSYWGHGRVRLVVDDASSAIPDLMRWFEDQRIEVEAISEFQPPFDDVFVQLIRSADVDA